MEIYFYNAWPEQLRYWRMMLRPRFARTSIYMVIIGLVLVIDLMQDWDGEQ